MNILLSCLWLLGLAITIRSGIDLIVNLIRFSQSPPNVKFTFWMQGFGLLTGITVMVFMSKWI